MSISTIQEKLFNKGCGSALVVAAALAMGVSMFSGQCNAPDGTNGNGGPGSGPAVATVDGIPVSEGSIRELAATSGAGNAPIEQAAALARATGQSVRSAAIRDLVAKGGAVTSPEIERAALVALGQQLDNERMRLASTGKIKFDASDADFEKALKPELGGKSFADLRKDTVDSLKTRFAAPETKATVVDLLGPAILASRLGEKAVGSDKELRDSYKSYVVKRIFFGAQTGSKETPEARAAKAAAALKAGTSFDKLMDTVSNDAAPPGKPAHEATQSIPFSTISTRPELAGLVGKPDGTTTGVVDDSGGKAIYRLQSVADGAPADFEANKAKYRAEKITALGSEKLQAAVTDLVSKSVKWQSKGFQALSAVATAQGNPLETTKAVEVAQAAVGSKDAEERKLGAYALLLATSSRPGAPPDPSMRAPRLAALEAAKSVGLEDAGFSLELADIYAEAKDAPKTAAALAAASRQNLRYDSEGQRVFREVATKLRKFTDSKLLNADGVKEIVAQQAVWQAARATSEKSAATGEKANEAEIARQKAEAAKGGGVSATMKPPTDVDKANEAEVARQKAEAAKGKGK